jgi:hypothetical protein
LTGFALGSTFSACSTSSLGTPGMSEGHQVMRVNSTNVKYEGLRIREVGRRMNSKVKSVKQGVYRK